MTETQLKLGLELKNDRDLVYDQMKAMKDYITQCSRKSFKTENCKENYDAFKTHLLGLCDTFVEKEKERIDNEFNKV